MKSDSDRNQSLTEQTSSVLERRTLLRGALTAGGLLLEGTASRALAQEQEKAEPQSTSLALALARVLNRPKFADLPPVPVKYAKMILASTLASAASGAQIGSDRIVRDLEKEQGGRPDATVWFDGAKLPISSAARVNAMASAASASDDSDLRNIAHTGTTLAAVGLAIGERTGATGTDILSAMVLGYESAGRIGDALAGSRQGFHASVIVAFGGVVLAARLLRLTDEQMANAIGITATTMGGLGIGTNSWAREYHDGNVALCVVNAALAAARGYTVNPDMLEARGGFLAVFGDGKFDRQRLTRDAGPDWDIVKYMAVKLVPGAHAYQASAEAAVNAARQAGVSPDEVAQILVAGPQSRFIVGRQRLPQDMVEAIHSLPYFVASAVADKDFSWVHTNPDKFHRPIIVRLIGLVAPDPAPPAIQYEWNWGSTVTVVTKSGARFTSTVKAPKGSGPRGIEWSDIDAKYRALVPDSGLPAKRIDEIQATIHDFDQVKHAAEFTRLLH
ncbi:MAG: MmgE/PrpD family protein [Acidobacteriia bacterium]|nr:MmgE/PrpD family protein [Terriglobia bacterium]